MSLTSDIIGDNLEVEEESTGRTGRSIPWLDHRLRPKVHRLLGVSPDPAEMKE
jgi:hypothetical protein